MQYQSAQPNSAHLSTAASSQGRGVANAVVHSPPLTMVRGAAKAWLVARARSRAHGPVLALGSREARSAEAQDPKVSNRPPWGLCRPSFRRHAGSVDEPAMQTASPLGSSRSDVAALTPSPRGRDMTHTQRRPEVKP